MYFVLTREFHVNIFSVVYNGEKRTKVVTEAFVRLYIGYFSMTECAVIFCIFVLLSLFLYSSYAVSNLLMLLYHLLDNCRDICPWDYTLSNFFVLSCNFALPVQFVCLHV